MKKHFAGLRTVKYHVPDVNAAKEWYTKVLGYPPYFDEPFYVGFNVGGFELGLLPDEGVVVRGNSPLAYWGVENAQESLSRLLSLGATADEPLQDVGGGIVVGSVRDPWGNAFGIIENPHFKIE